LTESDEILLAATREYWEIQNGIRHHNSVIADRVWTEAEAADKVGRMRILEHAFRAWAKGEDFLVAMLRDDRVDPPRRPSAEDILHRIRQNMVNQNAPQAPHR